MRGRYRSRNRFSRRRRSNKKVLRYDINQFINKSPSIPNKTDYTPNINFFDLEIDEILKNNLLKKGYTLPTPIQDQTILLSMEGKDVIGLANTGTGKTGAFLIPLINKVIKNKNELVLIVAPTRELALQINEEFISLAFGTRIYSALCIGGADIRKQVKSLGLSPNFIIATPGRILDLQNRKKVDLGKIKNIVLDEVDRMMDMGFLPDIKKILSLLPSERQSLFFSATISNEIDQIIREFLINPEKVSVLNGLTAKNIYQDVVLHSKNEDKIKILVDLLKKEDFKKTLVFTATKRYADTLKNALNDAEIRATSIHGDKSQYQRQRSLDQFKKDKINVLIATDVAARGLDITNVSHVINFDLPQSYEDYIHRIGRTGRAGKGGTALTFFQR